MKTTIRDVAKAAGVSPMAVSSVLHGTGKNVRVSAATAKRIREAAEELHYRPNTFARSLRSGKTYTVGVVMRNFTRFPVREFYYQHVFNGIMAALFPANYTLALCPNLILGDDNSAIVDGRYDGILWARPDFSDEVLVALKSHRLPTVLLHAPPAYTAGLPTFAVDNREGYAQIASHLADLGHQHIAYLTLRPLGDGIEDSERWLGFESAAQNLSMEVVRYQWDETPEGVRKFKEQHPQVTAIAAFSDTVALSFIDSCQVLGISIPEDLSLTGFDSIPQCQESNPPLTSMYQPIEQMAYDAVQCLLDLIEHPEKLENPESLSQIYTGQLDIRQSTINPKVHAK